MNKELIKQLGPVPEYPPSPNRGRPFVLQVHARGKSIHLDLRFLLDEFAEGWTISAAIQDAVPWPILTRSQLDEIVNTPEAWKIDFETGLVLPREVRTTIRGRKRSIIRTGSLFAERKAQVIPPEWLKVEGRTGFPPDWPKTVLSFWDSLPRYAKDELRKEGFDPGWAEEALKKKTWDVKEIPVGATRAYPGVFAILDEGTYTLGARKVWFYEYFIEHGNVLAERIAFRLVARARTIEKAILMKRFGALILPPSEDEARGPDPGYWIFTTPEPRPYVLSNEAISEGWLPPYGVAALPQKLQKSAPTDMRFWEKKSLEDRKRARLELSEWFEDKGEQEEAMNDQEIQKQKRARFKFLRQTFKGQAAIRFGPSTTIYWFILDEPKLSLALDNDPFIRQSVAGMEMESRYVDLLWGVRSASPEPGSELNPTKDTPSSIELVEEGEAIVMEQEPGFLRFKLNGKELSGYFICSWEEKNSRIVLFGKASNIDTTQGDKRREIEKADWSYVAKNSKKQIAYGIVLSPHGPDGHGHLIPEDVIETAAHRYMIFGRQIGVFHYGDPIRAYPVESFIARADFELEEGNPNSLVRKGEWVLGVFVASPEDWKLFETGEVNGFSIQGLAEIESVGG